MCPAFQRYKLRVRCAKSRAVLRSHLTCQLESRPRDENSCEPFLGSGCEVLRPRKSSGRHDRAYLCRRTLACPQLLLSQQISGPRQKSEELENVASDLSPIENTSKCKQPKVDSWS